MSFLYSISSLTFSDGSTVDLSVDDIVVLVGPNNAGKSAALREIITLLDSVDSINDGCRVLNTLRAQISTEEHDLRDWIAKLEPVPNSPGHVGRMGASLDPSNLIHNRANHDWMKRVLRGHCTYLVNTENRLLITNPVQSIDFVNQLKQHPFHYLYDDDALETEISNVFSKAFGTDLVVNRFGGTPIPLHVGRRPHSISAFNVDREFRTALAKLPQLHTQGDGMRAFVGCLMWAVVVDYPIVLIDEPEAFLHPPQARLLGRTLAKRKRVGSQLILATHSGDLLRGLLDAAPKSLRILRIVREGDVNRVTELKPQQVSELWSDPILRQSNPLDGLFHSSVVLCEADGDCQFYSSVANTLADADKGRTAPDALFIHCGGKARMPKVATALRTVNVPVHVIGDFDILREKIPLQPLFEALGGNWDNLREDWETVIKAISSKKAQLDSKDFRQRVEAALVQVQGDVVPDKILDEIRGYTKKASAWAYAKNSGEAFIPSGEPSAAYARLKTNCAALGLRLVPVGELERFCPSIGLEGPAWVGEVMKRDLANDPELRNAREFVEPIFWPKKIEKPQ
jgi:ABC-type ATPase involved in cell division